MKIKRHDPPTQLFQIVPFVSYWGAFMAAINIQPHPILRPFVTHISCKGLLKGLPALSFHSFSLSLLLNFVKEIRKVKKGLCTCKLKMVRLLSVFNNSNHNASVCCANQTEKGSALKMKVFLSTQLLMTRETSGMVFNWSVSFRMFLEIYTFGMTIGIWSSQK